MLSLSAMGQFEESRDKERMEEAIVVIPVRSDESLKEGSGTQALEEGNRFLSCLQGGSLQDFSTGIRNLALHFQKQPMCGIHVLTR
jgi:hypothetical protein